MKMAKKGLEGLTSEGQRLLLRTRMQGMAGMEA